MKEAMLMKEVWVPSESQFNFKETISPDTGERKYILTGLMLPFDKISRNNVMYNSQSIIAKHKSLIGKPVMYNHKVDSDMLPKGHFIDSWVEDDGWYYKADIDPQEKDLIRKLERGDLRHVSIQLIGGKVQEKLGVDGKTYTEAWVDDIIEGSIVPAPGFLDTTAKFAEALHPEKFTEFSDDQIKDILADYDAKMSLEDIAKKYNTTVNELRARLFGTEKLSKEDVTTTTGQGAIAPSQPLSDEEKKKRIEKRAKEFLDALGEATVKTIIEKFYEDGNMMKSAKTPLGNLELFSYSDDTYSVKLKGKEWCFRQKKYSDALRIFNKIKAEAMTGVLKSPYAYD